MTTDLTDLKPQLNTISTVAVGIAAISSFLFGYSICVLNSSLGLITVIFEWCDSDWQADCYDSRLKQGAVTAAIYLAASMGALLIGRSFIAPLGSRRQICLSDVFFLLGSVICLFAQGVWSLVFGRLVSGIGLGISAIAAPVYLAEISPRERRGQNAAMHGVFITIGILASNVFGLPQGPPPSGPDAPPVQGLDLWFWRFLLAFPGVLALLQAALFQFVLPLDPPAFLVQKGRVEEARLLLYRIYGFSAPGEEEIEVELQIRALVQGVEEARDMPRVRVVDALCDPWLRFAIFLGFGLAALQQLCGINALMSYSNSLFQEAGIAPQDLTKASVAVASANVVVSICSSTVVDLWGRRKLLLFGTFVQAVSMLVLVLALMNRHSDASLSGIVAVVCFTLFVTSFSAGLGAVTWLYLSEIYPAEVRFPALSVCGIINWLCCFFVVFGGRLLSLEQSCRLFGAISAVGCFGMFFWVIETKGCSMEDSPVTPHSGRSSSTLFTPTGNKDATGDYHKLDDDDCSTVAQSC